MVGVGNLIASEGAGKGSIGKGKVFERSQRGNGRDGSIAHQLRGWYAKRRSIHPRANG